ncbi:TetR/AcrR family transcriptional regulator [Microbacterium sp. cf332]|uniref:TetR/AcrR family transcriptional regulator n=1 Tax=Microbacterium sp. cf332 TaxID=1761804 RepID=UPI000880955F|nr:TetR/AcrR family transcriptional regulator [Microbacterium sp. cf332]SDQ53632.1 transcriptional regulator, TetR family [Microbacterium sp. cf332]
MAQKATTDRPIRADAQRNKQRILEIAEQRFTDHGIAASLEEIARNAGFGVGTLYRHFPTREALLAELLEARASRLVEERERIRSSPIDAATALHQWLVALVEWSSAFHGLPAPLRDAITEETSPLTLTCEGYITITDAFLTAAQQEGTARPDARGRDLFLMALATSWIQDAAMADDATATAAIDLIRTGWTMR